jgi:hypothetical protein
MSAAPWRACVALLVAAAALGAVTTQVRAATSVADMRYFICALPLGIALTAWAVCRLSFGRLWLLAPLAALVFFTNLTHGGTFFKRFGARPTALCFYRELLRPANTDPFTPVAQWLNINAADGASVYVAPSHYIYPLMFSAPRVVYAWQLDPELRANPQFASLSTEHFKCAVSPDYLVAFGPHLAQMRHDIRRFASPGDRYTLVAKIDTYWQELYRPELFWRSFTPVTNYDADRDVVFVFKRVDVKPD